MTDGQPPAADEGVRAAVSDGAVAAVGEGAPAIAATGIVKRYGDRTVLDGVDLRVRRGEVVALLGPNGAGKTTLVEIIEGYRTANRGSVEVLGRAAGRDDRTRKAGVGLMLQSGGIEPRATPADVLRLYRSFFVLGRSPDELLDLVGLRAVARTRVRRLSGGERQRLSLALALVGDPPVLILDEPTAGMDPEARRDTRALIGSLRGEGRAILLTTHDLGDVEQLADRVAILHHGRIQAEGSPAELMQGAASELRFRLHAPASPEALQRLGAGLRGARAVVEPGAASRLASYRLEGAGATADAIAALAVWAVREGLLIVELRAGAASLEDRYLELTGDHDVEAAA